VTAGRSLIFASCRGSCGELDCLRSATAIHSVAVERPLNLLIEKRTLYG